MLGEVIWRFWLSCYQYVDNIELYLSFPVDPREAVETTNRYLETVLRWMRTNQLKLDGGKMGVLLVEGRFD